MQALNRLDDFALENDAAAHGLHAEHADVLLHELRQYLMFETPEVRIHDIQRHLDCVEPEPVFRRGLEHPQMNRWILMPGEADESAFAGLPRFLQSLNCAALRERA